MGQIIQRSPGAQHAFLRNYFLQFDVTRCHLAETGVQGPQDDTTEVMQDQVYGQCVRHPGVCKDEEEDDASKHAR